MSYRDDLRAYIRDNPQGYWFKAKLYGWGWMPATKEGWAVTLAFLLAIVGNVYRRTSDGVVDPATVETLVVETTLLVIVLILICIARGEPPRWQWGPPKRDETDTTGN